MGCGALKRPLFKEVVVRQLEKKKSAHFGLKKCTVDPVLFENFLTEDGDLLRAKFQAFKFPETNFVLFKGVVNVCLDRCNGVRCSNGQIGYGRRRKKREFDNESAAENQRVFEVSLSTVVKVGDEEDDSGLVGKSSQIRETFASETAVISEIVRPPAGSAQMVEQFGPSPAKFIDFQADSGSGNAEPLFSIILLLFVSILAFF